MAEAFSLYLHRPSGLHRLHPLTKLALAGFLLVASLVLPGAAATYVLFGALVLPLAAWGRLLGDLVGRAWRVVLPFAVSVFLIQGLFWHGGRPVLSLGPVSFKAEGLLFATAATGRILLVVSSFLLLALSTRPDALMSALAERGLPGTLTYLVLTTIQILPRFQARAQAILDAQRARGLETEGSLRRRLRALLPLVVPLILGSLVDVEARAIALEARGFSRRGPKTALMTLQDSPAQAALRGALALAAAALVLLRLALLLRP